MTIEQLLADYEDLEREDILAVLAFAKPSGQAPSRLIVLPILSLLARELRVLS